MGYSCTTQQPVSTAVMERLPATVMVAAFGILFEPPVGIPIGMTSALRQYGFRDRAFAIFSLLFLSMPMSVLGMVLMYVFAFQVQVFPLGGYAGWAALLVTVSNFVVDLAYTWLDPHVKYS